MDQAQQLILQEDNLSEQDLLQAFLDQRIQQEEDCLEAQVRQVELNLIHSQAQIHLKLVDAYLVEEGKVRVMACLEVQNHLLQEGCSVVEVQTLLQEECSEAQAQNHHLLEEEVFFDLHHQVDLEVLLQNQQPGLHLLQLLTPLSSHSKR